MYKQIFSDFNQNYVLDLYMAVFWLKSEKPQHPEAEQPYLRVWLKRTESQTFTLKVFDEIPEPNWKRDPTLEILCQIIENCFICIEWGKKESQGWFSLGIESDSTSMEKNRMKIIRWGNLWKSKSYASKVLFLIMSFVDNWFWCH